MAAVAESVELAHVGVLSGALADSSNRVCSRFTAVALIVGRTGAAAAGRMACFALESRGIEVEEVRRTASCSDRNRADWTGLAGVCSQSVAGRTARMAEGVETGRRTEPLIR